MTEERGRAQIVTYAQRLWDRGLVSGTSGNVSARLDDGDVLVTPASRCLGGLHPNDIVRVTASGKPRDAAGRATSELPLHLAVYHRRSDARCVVHVHPTFCVVWSLFGTVFPQETVGARETLGHVAWTDYRPAGSQELADLCGDAFATGTDVVLMERHGLSAIGSELETAFVLVDQAEEAARVAYFFRIGENA
ncbi:MAG TPA: class II aldolase/adducin family protein [Candidatus Baltobacteraceae bacterium]|jgi:L-fuculose-phosphate aldolase|nr:class II aldolase/adducin family protein [Candidatus Baltobacteraceae bacterium]